MNAERLRLVNVRTFADVTLVLQPGVTAVAGANGAGKSTLAMGIGFALFGADEAFRTRADPTGRGAYLSAGEDSGHAELEFEHRGERYRVRRGWSKGQPLLDLETEGGDGWTPLTLESVRATQQLLEGLLGLTADLYASSSYLAQGQTGAFTEAPAARRKAVIAEAVLGRDPVWPRLRGRANADRAAVERELVGLEAKLEQAETELFEGADVAERVTQAAGVELFAERKLARAEADLEALVERQQALERRVSERRAAEAEHAQALAELRRLRDQAEAAELARENIARARERLGDLADGIDVKMARDDYARLVEAFERRRHERAELKARLDGLGDKVCSACRRPFENREEIEAVERAVYHSLGLLPELPEPSRRKVETFAEQATERARLEERIATWEQAVTDAETDVFLFRQQEADADVAHTQRRLDRLPPLDPDEIAEAQRATLEARAAVNMERQRLDEAREQKARLEARLERLKHVEAERARRQDERTQLQAREELLAVLERAYGRDGIQALIVEALALPRLEQEANRILHELGTPYRVELRSQRATKDGDLVGALDIVVIDADGNERDYLTYSGGEKTRLAISLRVALAVWMAENGAESRLLVIDEPEGLDDVGMAALAGVMHSLEGVFERQVLVSHVPALRDAFDNTITVVRDDGASRIAGAA